MMFDKPRFQAAADIVYQYMVPTLCHQWPVLQAELGLDVWLKHENQTPLGAFKARGGLVYMTNRVKSGNRNGVISASTGNHGQSIPFAAAKLDVPATIVVPENNSAEKNAAMRALGARLVEYGHDFVAAKAHAEHLAQSEGLDMVPSFHPDLVAGVATYAHELFETAGELDAVYVPIGLGSGICGVIGMRDMLGLRTKVIGVVSENANAYALSFAAGKPVSTNSAATFAEGVAVREPHPDAVAVINAGADRIVEVSEAQIANAVRLLFRTTHNVAEGAGAVALAGVMADQNLDKSQRVAAILSGGNIDTGKFAKILAQESL